LATVVTDALISKWPEYTLISKWPEYTPKTPHHPPYPRGIAKRLQIGQEGGIVSVVAIIVGGYGLSGGGKIGARKSIGAMDLVAEVRYERPALSAGKYLTALLPSVFATATGLL